MAAKLSSLIVSLTLFVWVCTTSALNFKIKPKESLCFHEITHKGKWWDATLPQIFWEWICFHEIGRQKLVTLTSVILTFGWYPCNKYVRHFPCTFFCFFLCDIIRKQSARNFWRYLLGLRRVRTLSRHSSIGTRDPKIWSWKRRPCRFRC